VSAAILSVADVPLERLLVVAAAIFVLPALLALPGWAVAGRLAGPYRRTVAEPILALAVGALLVVGLGLGFVELRVYSPGRLAVAVLLAAATGLRPGVTWLRARWAAGGSERRWDLGLGLLLLVASLPWWATAVAPGYPPADRLVWTYAVIGRQLAEAGGIPASVAEWGMVLRWLPDYLGFNLISGAYEGLLGFFPGGDALVLAAWRVPVVLLGLGLVFAVLRCWLSRGPALAGTVLVGGSLTVLSKFNAYKPEALGIVLGLVACWLVVAGLRHRRSAWVLIGGLVLGLDLAVHAIAATVLGLFVVGVAVAEWGTGVAARPGAGALRSLGWLVGAALAGLALSVVVGVLFQGRPLVATEALRPSLAGGGDPTWTFFLRSTGDFGTPEAARPALPLARGVTTPWEGLTVASGTGWWFLVAVAVGAFFVLARPSWRGRAGVVGWALGAGLLGLGMAFFALRFETYVPRWTGLVRFGQYVPVLAGVGAAFGLEGGRWAWRLAAGGPPGPVVRRWVVRGVGVGAVVWLVAVAGAAFERDAVRLSPAGERALAELARLGAPGDVVLSNALTPGTIEFFTGLEAPLEGRQPLIEEPDVLAAANELLLRAHRFWTGDAGAGDLLGDLGVRWLLVADDPALLGASAGLGGSTGDLVGRPGVEVVWSEDGVAIARVGPVGGEGGAAGAWDGAAPGASGGAAGAWGGAAPGASVGAAGALGAAPRASVGAAAVSGGAVGALGGPLSAVISRPSRIVLMP
jgi:hypothetical protein